MEPYVDLLKRIIAESDIVLEILDARLVDYSRNLDIEAMIKKANKPRIFVINKSDMVSKKVVEKDIEKLNREGVAVYVTREDKKTFKILLSKIRQVFSKYGKTQIIDENHRAAKADIVVGVVGYPNVGKSSVINGLSFSKKTIVSKRAGTTHGAHWITASKEIKLIDTPGVIPLEYNDEVKLGLISARDAHRLKQPDLVAAKIVQMFIEKNKKAFEDYYGIKIDDETKSPYEIIEEIALKKSHLKKGGFADEIRMSIIIVKDWQDGKLKL